MRRFAIAVFAACVGCGGRVAPTGDGGVTDSAVDVLPDDDFDPGIDFGVAEEGFDSGIDFGVEDAPDAPVAVDGCVPHPRPEQCQTIVCSVELSACQESAPCVSSYNGWGTCMRDCGPTDPECVEVCAVKLVDAKAHDLANCVLRCACL